MSQAVRNLSVPILIVVVFSAIMLNQRNLRINSFKNGAACILGGVNSYEAKGSWAEKCDNYFNYKIKNLQAELDNNPETGLTRNERDKLIKQINTLNSLKINGAFPEQK